MRTGELIPTARSTVSAICPLSSFWQRARMAARSVHGESI
jgi:hypothetical protein